ncbi:MBOAT family O-acyltransferase [Helicobacter saguini]|uniref:MBOAT family O-acyltransferase n=1 Tax=Helicobacter saguini TaxID=1548018 RepID=UPI001F27FE7F|nr:MBOAT family O-acyltransferase [Helicobacter saguini]
MQDFKDSKNIESTLQISQDSKNLDSKNANVPYLPALHHISHPAHPFNETQGDKAHLLYESKEIDSKDSKNSQKIKNNRARLLLIIALIFNISLLCYFKYMDFFIESFNALFHTNVALLHIALPLGISFFTITQIAYLVDCYEGRAVERNIINYALFVTFFPHLIAGPILHHAEMMPQFSQLCNKILKYDNIARGLFIFSIGLFKKVFIADSFAKWANAGYSALDSGVTLNIFESWATSLSYTFQLYFDFSGYCDMAIGLGLLFNIALPINFASPYKSLNIAEFWRRWHITLGRFLRDYIYIPLGGNRNFRQDSKVQNKDSNSQNHTNNATENPLFSQSLQSIPTQPPICKNEKTAKKADFHTDSVLNRILTLRNLFIVAFISGLWHGAGLGFVIWGILHGLAMCIHRIYRYFLESMFGIKLKDSKINVNYLNLDSIKNTESKSQDSKMESKINKVDSNLQNSKMDSIKETKITESNLQDSKIDSKENIESNFINPNRPPTTLQNNKPKSPKLQAFLESKIYKILCWFITFNFINITWIFFRAENTTTAITLIKNLVGINTAQLPIKWYQAGHALQKISGTDRTLIYFALAIFICFFCKNSIEKLRILNENSQKSIKEMKIAAIMLAFSLWEVISITKTPTFLYFNF